MMKYVLENIIKRVSKNLGHFESGTKRLLDVYDIRKNFIRNNTTEIYGNLCMLGLQAYVCTIFEPCANYA